MMALSGACAAATPAPAFRLPTRGGGPVPIPWPPGPNAAPYIGPPPYVPAHSPPILARNVAAPQTTGPGGPAPHVPPTVARLVTAQPTAGQPSAPTNQPLLVSFRPRGLRTAPGHF